MIRWTVFVQLRMEVTEALQHTNGPLAPISRPVPAPNPSRLEQSTFASVSTLSPQITHSIPFSTMPPKRSSQPPSSAPSSSLTSAFTPTKPSASSSANTQSNSAQDVLFGIWNNYLNDTPQRVKLVDCFLAFLVVVGVLQFVYAVVGGSFVSFPLLCSKEGMGLKEA